MPRYPWQVEGLGSHPLIAGIYPLHIIFWSISGTNIKSRVFLYLYIHITPKNHLNLYPLNEASHYSAKSQSSTTISRRIHEVEQLRNPFITPLSFFLTALTLLELLVTLPQAPFRFHPSFVMPSDPSAAKASSSSSSAEKSSSSSSRDPRASSSSSSSSSKPSSSSSSSGPAVQPTPFISANAWMSFFLFCCLVLIILQGPLGLSGIGTAGVTGAGGGMSVFGNFGGGGAGIGGGIGCQGMAAGYVPWCQQVQAGYPMVVAQAQPVVQQVQAVPAVVHHHHQQRPIVVQQQRQQGPGYAYPPAAPGYGGQGAIDLPGGGGGRWSWYGNPNQYQYQYPSPRQYSEWPT